jgi:predicted  nucleic acid-binding Zn-ribbon protein
LQTKISERETELTQLRSDAYLSATERDKATRELEQLRGEHANLQSRLSNRENELVQLRTEAKDGANALDKTSRELDRLRSDHERLQATLAERESALEQSRAEVRDNASDLSKGEKELRRLRNECTKLQANAEKREKKLAQMRVVADDAVATRGEENKALRQLRKEYSKLESLVATQDAQIAQLRAALDNPESAPDIARIDAAHSLDEKPVPLADLPETEPQAAKPKIKLVEEDNYSDEGELVPETGIVLRTNKSWSDEKKAQKKGRKQKKGNFSRDAIVAAALAASAVIFYPIAMPYLPASMQLGRNTAPIAAVEAAVPEEPAEIYGTTIGAVNFRSGPSTASEVLSTLQADMRVVIVEENGNWTLIRVQSEDETAEPQEGWISSTFLEIAPVADAGTETNAVAAIAQTGEE